MLAASLNLGEQSRILTFKHKAPAPPEGHVSHLAPLYTNNLGQAPSRKHYRHIPQTQERILDAPDLVDDYYLNLVDWSSGNQASSLLYQPSLHEILNACFKCELASREETLSPQVHLLSHPVCCTADCCCLGPNSVPMECQHRQCGRAVHCQKRGRLHHQRGMGSRQYTHRCGHLRCQGAGEVACRHTLNSIREAQWKLMHYSLCCSCWKVPLAAHDALPAPYLTLLHSLAIMLACRSGM